MDCIDPFNAPEIFVDGVAYREPVGTEFMRTAFFSRERGETIIRVKLIIPMAICAQAHQDVLEWIAKQKDLLWKRAS